MSFRLKAPLSAVALAFLGVAACTDVKRQPPPDEVVLVAFLAPPTAPRAVLPLPSDLALRGAPGQPAGVQREVLFAFINGGGFPGDQTITIPLRRQVRNPETAVYEPSAEPPGEIDPATVTSSTVAIVRLDVAGAAPLVPEYVGQRIDPSNADIRQLLIRAKGGIPVGRYAVAVRGGASGLKTTAGLTVGADQAIALIAPNKDLSNPENQPPGGLAPAQVAALEPLRALFALPLDWSAPQGTPEQKEAQCRGILSIPQETPLPEQTCWVPPVNLETGQLVPTPGFTAAFAAVDAVFPHTQLASIQTFEIAASAPIVDSAASIVPFPSDFLRLTGPLVDHPLGGGQVVKGCEAVRLPGDTRACIRNIASLGPAAPGIASLDGVSTTSLVLTPLSAPVQASTINSNSVLVFEVTGGGPRAMLDVAAAVQAGQRAEYLLQPPALVQTVNGTGVSTAIGLQPAVPVPVNATTVVNLPPLKPKTTYVVMVTDLVKDTSNKPLARGTLGTLLFSLPASTVFFDGTNSNIPGLSPLEAAGIQTLRDSLRPLADGIEAASQGTATPKKVVLGFTLTTQDVKTVSADLTALPYTIEGGGPFFTTSNAADFDATAAPYGWPEAALDHVQKFVAAKLETLDVMSAQFGTLDPALPTWGVEQFVANKKPIDVLVAVPEPAVGETCTPDAPCARPLVVFHHGLNGARYQMIAVADRLADEGFVVAAIDAPLHGDRAACQTDADCASGTCTLQPANQKQPGVCAAGYKYDPARLSTVASGNYFVSENFFRIRDSIRQDLLDHSALVIAATRTAGATPPAGSLEGALKAAGVTIIPNQVYFAGLSLGGIIGTSLVATNPRVSRAVLDNAGGTVVDVVTNAPAFQTEVEELFAGLIPGFTFAKVTAGDPAFDPAVAQQYAQLLIVAKWALDPAEPVNYASDVQTKDAANATLRTNLVNAGLGFTDADVYGQMVTGDQVVPNAFSGLLYGNATNPTPIPTAIYTTDTIPAANLHGLLLAPPGQSFSAAGDFIRDDLARFLADPTDTVSTGPTALP